MLYERVILALLTESKVDSLSRTMTQKLIRAVKKTMDKVNKQRRLQLQYTQSWPPFLKRRDVFGTPAGRSKKRIAQGRPLDAPDTIKVILRIMLVPETNEDFVDIGGSWAPIEDELTIDVVVGSKTGTLRVDQLSEIQARAYEVFRHELEHSTQPDDYLVQGMLAGQGLHAGPKGAWSDAKAVGRYFLSNAEKEAFVSGLYHKAKRTRQPFHKVMDEKIQAIIDAATRKGVDVVDIRNIMMQVRYEWLQYAKKRFPEAVVQ